uniref:Plakophilin 1 n=1 Tax=Amphilophus citrinellus TaxID=61819 RepID=A0A3Q0S2F8_AMPCI
MAPDPLRSATTVGVVEDTSLALPSDSKLRSGQQRVLDQVHSIKRSKSKYGKSVRASSPTSMEITLYKNNTAKHAYVVTFLDGGTSMQKSRTLSTKASRGRYTSTSGVWEQQMNASTWPKSPNGLKSSQSDPALAPPFSNCFQISYPFFHSWVHFSRTNATENMPDLTLKEAVEFLSHPDENYQQWGATFIQHTCYSDESAKTEVSQLKGIPPLVTLLRSPSPSVSQAAAGALRNLVFKNNNNKLEVQDCGGIAKALQLLKESDSTETQKQVTGLLWNLSSASQLRGELTQTALPALTENVVAPFTGWSDNGVSSCIDPYVFHCATGCLRNLSCGEMKQREAMRNCPHLIDSLMSYMQSCVAEENPDDKSLENCACILHNLSYKLEQESRGSFDLYYTNRNAQLEDRKSPTVGCFSPKSSKFSFDTSRVLDASPPSGVKWLSHPKAIETYLSLLDSSKTDGTLEACCGALQNLTANKGQVSTKKLIIRIMMFIYSEVSKKVITNGLVASLSSKAASVLLCSLWNDKNLQSAVKKVN